MPTAAEVMIGNPELGTGGVFVATLGSTLPTDATTARDGAFADLGYISDDGVTEHNGTDSTEIKAWGGDVVRTVQTSHVYSLEFAMIQSSAAVRETFYGNETAGAVEVTGVQPERRSWIVEIADGDNSIRVVIPDGQVTERGDVVYKTDEPISYPVTITCYPDDDGVKAYIYADVTGS